MPIEDIIASLPAELRLRLERDAERAKHMVGGGHLQDWLDYEVSFWGIRNEAMRIAHVNRPEGRGYSEAHGQLMAHYGLNHLDGGTVSAVLWLTDPREKTKSGEDHLTRKEVLDGILKQLTPGQRSRLASPISARQRVQKRIAELEASESATDNASDDAKIEKPLSKLKQTEQMLAKALQEKHQLEEQLRRKDDGSLFDLKNDTVENIVMAIASNVSPNKAESIGKRLVEHVKRKRQRPAG
jgi:hypothetical protein